MRPGSEGARIRPRKRFGQHFLHDPGVLRRIVDAIDPAPGDRIVEIGPGQGALTRPLLGRAGRLTAIEIDRDLATELAAALRSRELEVLCKDALRVDYSSFAPGFRLVGNLPYNISTPLLFHLARSGRHARDLHFMLQLEVVERMVAAPSTAEYGRLSVALQTRFTMHKLFKVAAGCFKPPPKVDSAVVRMSPLPEGPGCDESILDNVLRRAFSARRKTLRNALPLEPQDYAALGIDPGLRPENLGPGDYIRIARRIGG